jgi:hypothetical protein
VGERAALGIVPLGSQFCRSDSAVHSHGSPVLLRFGRGAYPATGVTLNRAHRRKAGRLLVGLLYFWEFGPFGEG